jgi:hypothetical protein
LEHEKAVSQHDKRQMAMQAIPAPSLVVIEAAFLFGIDVETAR